MWSAEFATRMSTVAAAYFRFSTSFPFHLPSTPTSHRRHTQSLARLISETWRLCRRNTLALICFIAHRARCANTIGEKIRSPLLMMIILSHGEHVKDSWTELFKVKVAYTGPTLALYFDKWYNFFCKWFNERTRHLNVCLYVFNAWRLLCWFKLEGSNFSLCHWKKSTLGCISHTQWIGVFRYIVFLRLCGIQYRKNVLIFVCRLQKSHTDFRII